MNETLQTIDGLHSTHGSFSQQPIEEETLQTILSASIRGANASNRQGYSIVVVRGAQRVQSVLGCGYAAPAALLFCVDYNRITAVGERLGYPSDFDNLLSFFTGYTDAVIAAQTAVIAAASLGLASLFTNSIHNANRKNLDELYEELSLPQTNLFPVTAVLLGYEKQPPAHQKGRLSLGVIHDERYQALSTAQLDEVIEYVNDPNNHMSIAPSAHKNYLEFYYTQWEGVKSAEETAKLNAMLLDKLGSFLPSGGR